MKKIARLQDLAEFGINPLTGEADAIAYRALCDLTEEGRALVAETYGLLPAGFPDNWNSGAVASCMLPYDAWRHIAPIALTKCCHVVFETQDSVVGIEDGEEFERAPYDCDTGQYIGPARIKRDGVWMDWPSCYGTVGRNYCYGSGPHVGSRNTHATSGRTM